VRERIVDRARGLALCGQGAQRFFQPASQIVEQRPGAGLANRASQLGRLATGIFFNAVQSADASDGFGGDGRGVNRMDVVKLASGVGPARYFIDVAAVEMMKSCVGIGL
jgi:hypothetical protein